MAGKYQVRSVSLPSRFHPTIVRIEQEINKLKSWDKSSATSSNEICSLLSGLEVAYGCADELLNMQSGFCKNDKLLSDMFDGSVKILDVSSTLRETLSMVKGHVQGIQSALRRKKDDYTIQKSVSEYLRFRKHMTKNGMKMIDVLKQVIHVSTTTTTTDLYENSSTKLIIKILKLVTEATVSVFESLLKFLAASSSAKVITKWSLINKLMKTREVARPQQGEVVNEFLNVDAIISEASSAYRLVRSDTQQVLEKLEALEIGMGRVEARLECLFRCLIKLRVSVLNRIST